jgi:hypothetical protein
MAEIALLLLAITVLVATLMGSALAAVYLLIRGVGDSQRELQEALFVQLSEAMRTVITSSVEAGSETMKIAAAAMAGAVAETYPHAQSTGDAERLVAELKAFGDIGSNDQRIYGTFTDASDPFDNVADPRADALRTLVEPVIRGAQSAGIELDADALAMFARPDLDAAGDRFLGDYESALDDIAAAGPEDGRRDGWLTVTDGAFGVAMNGSGLH